MKIKIELLAFSVAVALLLTACGAGSQQKVGGETEPAAAAGETFRCENGAVVMVMPDGEDRIRLRLGEESVQLTVEKAASGVRYAAANGLFGKATEWHVKNGEAAFDYTPKGDAASVFTVCRVER